MFERAKKSRRDVLAMSAALAATPASAAKDVATELYRGAIVIDGNLIADPLISQPVVSRSVAAQVRASGLTAMKQTLGDTGDGFAKTEKAIAELRAAIARNANLFVQISQTHQIAEAKRTGKVGIIFSFESASMLDGRLPNIDHFAGEGVRVMGLSYNAGSPFGGGTLQGPSAGLTPLGREAVALMAKLGVTIDISHSNEATGFDVLTQAKTPVLITHAGSAAVHPHPRNKSDRLIRAVAEAGGVTGIYDLSYLGNYPDYPTLDIYMRHLTHAIAVCGEDHVGIGSDSVLLGMDTSPDSAAAAERHEAVRKAAGVATPEELPIPFVIGLNGPNRCEVICRALLRQGYRERTVEKVLGANFFRVFAETWMPSGAKPE